VVIAVLLLPPNDARAGSYYVEARGYVQGFTGAQNNLTYINGNYQGTGNLAQQVYNFNLVQSAYGEAAIASAILGGYVSPGAIGTSATSQGLGVGGAEGIISAALTWGDTLTLLSTSLPKGTPINLQFTLALSGNLGVTGDNFYVNHIQDPNSAIFQAGLSVFLPGAGSITATGGLLDGTTFGYPPNFPAGLYTMSAIAQVGDSFAISGYANSSTVAYSGTLSPEVTAFVDAEHTSRVFVQVLTPGVTLESASGATYAPAAAAVPEPGTWVLLISAVLCLAVFRTLGCRGGQKEALPAQRPRNNDVEGSYSTC